MGNTSIEWTQKTWNPVRGCTRVSPGCQHCYAERFAARFAKPGEPYEGLVKLVSRDGRKTTMERDRVLPPEPRWTGEVRLVPEHLADPLRWKKPLLVFVNSMSDLFHEDVPNEYIAAVFGVMAASPRHTFQILTKRTKRMREWFRWMEERVEDEATEWVGRDCGVSIHDARHACMMEYLDETACAALAGHFDCCHLGLTTAKEKWWPLPNVWIGASMEDQQRADERMLDLLATPASVRFVSLEPLLGPISLGLLGTLPATVTGGAYVATHERLHWVIAGCESGPDARPAQVAWYRSLRDECAETNTPFFLKQAVEDGVKASLDPHAPESVSLFAHGAAALHGAPVAKYKAGRIIALPYLDGVQHVAFPEAACT